MLEGQDDAKNTLDPEEYESPLVHSSISAMELVSTVPANPGAWRNARTV